MGLCGEYDFRYLELKKAKLPARKAGILQGKSIVMYWIWEVFGSMISVGL
jgi:hypothetical protein